MTLEERIETAKNSLAAATTDEQRDLFRLGIQKLNDLLEQQKKSESQPTGKTGQLGQNPDRVRPELNPSLGIPALNETPEKLSADKVKEMENTGWEKVREALPAMARAYDEIIKTVKAPAFVAPDELINVILEDSKGNEYTRIGTKAQVRALTRKYFSNVHESWMGKERKMKTGFKNLLAYVVAWKEFDGALPVLRDVLPDYDRYNKGGEDKEASEAFKVAQELYGKIAEILKD